MGWEPMKDTYWFKHDSNARNDLKLVKLRRLSGLEGIGLFWCVIEMLRESENYKLPYKEKEDICFDLRSSEKAFDDMFEAGLLHKKDDMFFSNALNNRMEKLDIQREKSREGGIKSGISRREKPKLGSTKSEGPSKGAPTTLEPLDKIRVDKIRVDKIRVDKNIILLNKLQQYVLDTFPAVKTVKTQLTNEQCEKLLKDYGWEIVIEKLEVMENRDAKLNNGRKYKSVYLTIKGWCKDGTDKRYNQTGQNFQNRKAGRKNSAEQFIENAKENTILR